MQFIDIFRARGWRRATYKETVAAVRGREDTHDSEIINPQTRIRHSISHVD